jgi:hypothetical protein
MNSVTVPHATQHANANDAIEAIQTELGTDPAGASATVKARLDALDTTVGGKAPSASPTFTGTVTIPNVDLDGWTSYTPTISGTGGWAIGNGTEVGFYCRVGRIIHVRGKITFGSTSTYGTGALYMAAPVTAAGTGERLGSRAFDVSTSRAAPGFPWFESTTSINLSTAHPFDVAKEYAITSTTPFTWADGDYITFNGTFEAAS